MEKEKQRNKLLFLIFIACIFLRLFKLGSLPNTLHIDEAGLLYNIQCLINGGTDQAGNSWPLLFANYHSEQSAMYTYLAFIYCKLFGVSTFAIRLPAVLNMILVFIFGNKIVTNLYSNKNMNIFVSILLMVCPYFVLNTRMALDCNLMLGFSMSFLYLFIKAIDNGNIMDAFCAGTVCGTVLYTYVLSYITLPLFLIVSLIFLIKLKKISLKQICAFVIPLILLAVPLISIQIINVFEFPEFVIGGITFPNFEAPRHNDIGLLSIFTNFLTPLLYILFTPGRLYECIFDYGNFQWILVPFLLIGIVLNIKTLLTKQATIERGILVLFWISVYITCTVVHKDMTTWHLNSLMFISLIFIIDGINWSISKIKAQNKRTVLIYSTLILFILSTIFFFGYYYCGTYSDDEANSYYVYEDIMPALEIADELKSEEQIYVLLPSVVYRVKNETPWNNPQSQYQNSKELPIMIDGYMFDMGAKVLQNPDRNAIYIVGSCYEDYRRVLENLGLEHISIGHYLIYKEDMS